MLYLPAGVKGLYVGKQSEMMHEDEFILGAGPSFRVFQFSNESFPLKLRDKSMYRLACNDCKEIYNINGSYDKQLLCDEKMGCQIVTNK